MMEPSQGFDPGSIPGGCICRGRIDLGGILRPRLMRTKSQRSMGGRERGSDRISFVLGELAVAIVARKQKSSAEPRSPPPVGFWGLAAPGMCLECQPWVLGFGPRIPGIPSQIRRLPADYRRIVVGWLVARGVIPGAPPFFPSRNDKISASAPRAAARTLSMRVPRSEAVLSNDAKIRRIGFFVRDWQKGRRRSGR